MKLHKVLVTILFCSGLNMANGQPQSLSLKQAQDYAVQHNATVKMAETDVEISRKKIQETTAIGLPQVKASASYQNFLDIPTTLLPDFISPSVYGVLLKEGLISPGQMPSADDMQFFPAQFGTQHNLTLDISASLLLFNGAYIVGLQAAKIYKDFSIQSLGKSERDIRNAVAQSYYLVLVAEENLQIIDSSLITINRTVFEIQAMNKEGFIEETDVDQMQITAAEIQNARDNLIRQIEVARRLLKFQIGMDLATPISLTDKLEPLLGEANLLPLVGTEFSPSSNLEYQLMETQERLSILNHRREQTTMLPTISTFFTHQQRSMLSEFKFFDKSTEWYPTSIIGVGIEVPILSSGMRLARTKQAKLQLDKVRMAKQQVSQGLSLEFEQAKSTYASAQQRYLIRKNNYELSKKIYNRTLVKYQQGVGGSFELTQAQNQFLNNQAAYYNAMLDILNAKLAMDKLLGK